MESNENRKPIDLLEAQLLNNGSADFAERSFLLGFLSYAGLGVEQNYEVALVHFRKAADAGSPWAQHAIGLMHETGRGVAKDLRAALEWYGRAAKQGHAPAACARGLIFKYGPTEIQDQEAAIECFEAAAGGGSSMAALQLGDSLERGLGRDANEVEARQWYFKAIQYSDESTGAAYVALATIYRTGRLGIPIDMEKAEELAKIGRGLVLKRWR